MKYEHLPEGWSQVRLSKVLQQQYRKEDLQEGIEYTTLGVRWYGGGTFIKQERDGDDISSTYLNRVEEGDFIYNRLFAWKGSFAVVPPEHAGYYVSNEFPVFTIKTPDTLDLNYLLWYTKHEHFWTYIASLSTGTSNASRLRWKEDDFLRETIPLPPIDEQRRIAEILRDADANIAQVEAQIEAAQEVKQGMMQLYFNDINQTDTTRVNHVLKRIRREVDVDPDATYREIGIRSHGRGIFHKNPIIGKELGKKSVYWVEPGDFVLNIVFAWEGAVALVSEAERDMCGSHRFPTYEINHMRIYPDYLLYYFKSFEGVVQLLSVSPGGAGRNKTLNQSDFIKLKIPLPDMMKQCEIASTLQAHDNITIALLEERDRLTEVKRGLMQKLLSGEVRV